MENKTNETATETATPETEAVITLAGNIRCMTLRGQGGRSKTKFCLTSPDLDALSSLAKSPASARKMFGGAMSGGGKTEIPCESALYSLRLEYNGAMIREARGVELTKIVFKRADPFETKKIKPEPKAELHLSEPAERNAIMAEYDHLGYELVIRLQKQQKEMFAAEQPAEGVAEGDGDQKPEAGEGKKKRRGKK